MESSSPKSNSGQLNPPANDKKDNSRKHKKSPRDVQSIAKGLVGVVRPSPVLDYGLKREIKIARESTKNTRIRNIKLRLTSALNSKAYHHLVLS